MWFIAGCLMAGAVVGISNYFIVKFTIRKTLANLASAFEELADKESDLTVRLDVLTKDEIGEIATLFNAFVGKLQQVVKSVTENVAVVTSSSYEFSRCSQEMHTGASSCARSRMTLQSLVGQLTTQMSTARTSMEQDASSANQLAKAIGQIADSVSHHCRKVAHNLDR